MEVGKKIFKINLNNTSYIKDIEEKITRLEKVAGYSFDEILSRFLQGYTLKMPDYLGVPTSFLEKYGK